MSLGRRCAFEPAVAVADAALREAGCMCPEEVHAAFLENNGTISVIPRARG